MAGHLEGANPRTAAEMKELDRRAIEEFGIPSLLLMENAGRGVAVLMAHVERAGPVAVFCGKGNNGGDGFVAARHLANRGYEVEIFLFADPDRLKADPRVNFAIIEKMGIPVEVVRQEIQVPEVRKKLANKTILVDALFGIGLNSEVTGLYRRAIELINDSAKTVIAVDIPSGLDTDTGMVHGVAVRASRTAALGAPKIGFLKGEGPQYVGQIHLVDIGLPRQIL